LSGRSGEFVFATVSNKISPYSTHLKSYDSQSEIVVDGAATTNLVGCSKLLQSPRPDPRPVRVETAGTEVLRSVQLGHLALPLVPKARLARYVPGMSANLLSVPQLTKTGYSVLYTHHKCFILKNKPKFSTKSIVITASRNKSNLYTVDPPQHANRMLSTHYSVANQNTFEAIKFYHKAFLAAPASVLYHAVLHFDEFKSFPNLTAKAMLKNWPFLQETYVGHNRLIPSGRNSTAPKVVHLKYTLPFSLSKARKKDKVYADTVGAQLPFVSSKGNKYILNTYCEEYDITHSECLPDLTSASLLAAYKRAIKWYSDHGYTIKNIMTDNATSKQIREYFLSPYHQIAHEKCPPSNHRANKSERDIQTFQSYMLSALALLDDGFPPQAWDEIVEHVDFIICLLRPSPFNPNKSAWSVLTGADFDFNRTPFVPVGAKASSYIVPNNRQKWIRKADTMYFVGVVLDGYRQYKMLNPTTNKVVNRDSVIFHPTHYTLPDGNSAQILETAISTLSATLKSIITPTVENTAARRNAEILLEAARELGQFFRLQLPVYETKTIDTNPTPRFTVTAPPPSDENSTQPPRVLLDEIADNLPGVESTDSNTPPVTVTANQVKASAPTKVMRRIQPSDYSSTYATPSDIAVDMLSTAPNKDQRHPSKAVLYESGFIATFAPDTVLGYTVSEASSNPLTRRAHDVSKGTYRQEQRQDPEGIKQAAIAEIHRLIEETKCGKFVGNIPKGAKVIRANDVVEKKYDEHNNLKIRIRTTANGKTVTSSGQKVDYLYGNTSKVASSLAVNIVLNALVSGRGRAFRIDIKDFYLQHDIDEPHYMIMDWKKIPQEVRDKYNLTPHTNSKGQQFVYMEISKTMYGLKQANSISEKQLRDTLAKGGYYYTGETGVYVHPERKTIFCLHVDDFFPVVFGKTNAEMFTNAQHLVATIARTYGKVKVNFCGLDQPSPPKRYVFDYCGLDLDHDTTLDELHMSMKDYYNKLVSSIPSDIKPRNIPGQPYDIQYGQKEQFSHESEPIILTSEQKAMLQKFCGEAIWYSKVAVETSVAISRLAKQIHNPTSGTIDFFKFLQGYFKRWGNHTITYTKSEMILHAMSDASHDSEPGSKSRGACVLWLGNAQPHLINGPIAVITQTLPGVPTSAATAEIEQHFVTGDYVNQARNILEAIGYKQKHANIILADNMCSIDYAHDQIKGKRLKSLDRRLNWTKHMVEQNIHVYRYVTSANNLADLPTKLHPRERHDYLSSFLVKRERMLLAKLLNTRSTRVC